MILTMDWIKSSHLQSSHNVLTCKVFNCFVSLSFTPKKISSSSTVSLASLESGCGLR